MSDTLASPTPQLFQHLPAPVREALLGQGEDGRGGVVADLLDRMLLHFERPAREPFKAPERRRAVQRALAWGLSASLQRWHPSTPEPVELEKLRAWMQEHAVTEHLAFLLRRAPESQLDVRLLSKEMVASEFSVEELGQRDGEAWLRVFVAGFYEGVAREQRLHEIVDLPSLRQLAERMGAALPPPGEAEGVTAQLEYLRGLAQRLYQGEDLREDLLKYVRTLLSASGTSSPVQQQATYQAVQEVLGRAGLATDGEEEIPDSSGTTVALEAGASRLSAQVHSALLSASGYLATRSSTTCCVSRVHNSPWRRAAGRNRTVPGSPMHAGSRARARTRSPGTHSTWVTHETLRTC